MIANGYSSRMTWSPGWNGRQVTVAAGLARRLVVAPVTQQGSTRGAAPLLQSRYPRTQKQPSSDTASHRDHKYLVRKQSTLCIHTLSPLEPNTLPLQSPPNMSTNAIVDETPISPVREGLERRNTLENKLAQRPDPQDLKDRHILLDTAAAPYAYSPFSGSCYHPATPEACPPQGTPHIPTEPC